RARGDRNAWVGGGERRSGRGDRRSEGQGAGQQQADGSQRGSSTAPRDGMGRHWVSSTHRMKPGGTLSARGGSGAACKVTRKAPARNQFADNELLRRRNVSPWRDRPWQLNESVRPVSRQAHAGAPRAYGHNRQAGPR